MRRPRRVPNDRDLPYLAEGERSPWGRPYEPPLLRDREEEAREAARQRELEEEMRRREERDAWQRYAYQPVYQNVITSTWAADYGADVAGTPAPTPPTPTHHQGAITREIVEEAARIAGARSAPPQQPGGNDPTVPGAVGDYLAYGEPMIGRTVMVRPNIRPNPRPPGPRAPDDPRVPPNVIVRPRIEREAFERYMRERDQLMDFMRPPTMPPVWGPVNPNVEPPAPQPPATAPGAPAQPHEAWLGRELCPCDDCRRTQCPCQMCTRHRSRRIEQARYRRYVEQQQRYDVRRRR